MSSNDEKVLQKFHAGFEEWKRTTGGTDSREYQKYLDSQKPSSKPEKRKIIALELRQIEDMYLDKPEEFEWVIDGLLRAGGSCGVYGQVKLGKSYLLRQMCWCVSQGIPFWGRSVTQGKVLYLGFEDHKQQILKHYRAMDATLGDKRKVGQLLIRTAPVMSQHIERLEQTLAENPDIIMVAVDPLVKFARMADVKDYSPVTYAIERLHNIARANPKLNISFSHHANKRISENSLSSNALGSTGMPAGTDQNFYMSKEVEDTRGPRFVATEGRENEFDIPKTRMEFDTVTRLSSLGNTKENIVQNQKESNSARIKHAIEKVLRAHPESEKDFIMDHVSGNPSEKKRALKSLEETGFVTKIGPGKPGKPFLYSWRQLETLEGATRVVTPDGVLPLGKYALTASIEEQLGLNPRESVVTPDGVLREIVQ